LCFAESFTVGFGIVTSVIKYTGTFCKDKRNLCSLLGSKPGVQGVRGLAIYYFLLNFIK
jgi:hypothetical protein